MIVLAGTIGVGKSSLTKILSDHLNTQAFYESVDDNPVLDLYYTDPVKCAFLLQIYFLNKRFENIKEAYKKNNNVLDRSIFEDELFLTINYKNGNVTKTELQIYKELLNNMLEDIEGLPKKSPDLLIYLEIDYENMLKRIKRRGREFEQFDNSPELMKYYKQVNDEYPDWYENYNASPKMKIKVNDLDFVNKEIDKQYILTLIDQKLKDLKLIEEGK